MTEVLLVEEPGLAGFRLDQGGGRRFTKDVLRTGSWVHPTTGQKIVFDRASLEQLARDTNTWIALGNKVYFPDGHTTSALANLGTWSRFTVEGDVLKAQVEVADDQAAQKVGKTITDVSPAIQPDVRASTGEQFKAVILHVAATPEPVIPGQANFVRLARSGTVTALSQNMGQKNGPKETPMSKLLSMTRKMLGLPEDTSEDAICSKLEGAKLSFADPKNAAEDDAEDAADDGKDESEEKMSKKLSRELDETRKQVKALEDDRARRTKKAAEEKVALARRRSVELGIPLEDDVAKDAISLLSREDEESQRLGDRILKLAHDRATAKPIYSRELENPGRKLETEEPNQVLLAAGYKAKKDDKGRIQGYAR